MEITSGILTKEQIEKEIAETPDFLKQFGIKEIVVYWGFGWDHGCNDHIENLWKEKQIDIDEFQHFVSKGINSGIFEPSKRDLYIINEDVDLELQFCHDSDIHFNCGKEEITKEKERIWKEKGFPGYTKMGEEWIPFDEQNS